MPSNAPHFNHQWWFPWSQSPLGKTNFVSAPFLNQPTHCLFFSDSNAAEEWSVMSPSYSLPQLPSLCRQTLLESLLTLCSAPTLSPDEYEFIFSSSFNRHGCLCSLTWFLLFLSWCALEMVPWSGQRASAWAMQSLIGMHIQMPLCLLWTMSSKLHLISPTIIKHYFSACCTLKNTHTGLY